MSRAPLSLTLTRIDILIMTRATKKDFTASAFGVKLALDILACFRRKQVEQPSGQQTQ
jgi:hypothetical protein